MHPARQAYVEEDVPEVSHILKMPNSLSCVHMGFQRKADMPLDFSWIFWRERRILADGMVSCIRILTLGLISPTSVRAGSLKLFNMSDLLQPLTVII